MEILEHYSGPAELLSEQAPPQHITVELFVEQEMVTPGFEQEPIPGMKSWRADVRAHPAPLLVGRARLRLPDGRSGDCNVGGQAIDVTGYGDAWHRIASGCAILLGDGPLQ